MRLDLFEIESFRAFGTKQSVKFAHGEAGKLGSGLTVFVGPNNSGKSTILHSIRSVLSNDPTFIAGIEDRRPNKLVNLRLAGQTSAGEMFDITLEQRSETAHLKKIGLPQGATSKLRYIPARRPWYDKFHAGSGMLQGEQHEFSLFSNLKQNSFYVDSEFGRSMFAVEGDPERKANYSRLLRDLEPTITDWTIDNNGQDYISFKSVSGHYHRVGLVGEGVNNLFRIVYSLFEFGADDVLLLDEPELSLHPQGQRRLHEQIRSRSPSGQIILSTHSPYFVSWDDVNNGAQVYRTNLVSGDGSRIGSISPATKKLIIAVAQEKKNRKLYDVLAKEVFFSLGCLFVEGQEDAHIIASYLEEAQRPPIEIFGYGSGGASHIQAWLSLAVDLGIKAAALFDGDCAGCAAYKDAEERFKDSSSVLLKLLPTEDIRDKLKENKSGIFDSSWQLKAEHRACWEALLLELTQFLCAPTKA